MTDLSGKAGTPSGFETNRAAWANIAVLQDRVGNPTEAISAYRHALGDKGREEKRSDDKVDSDALLRVTDPANQLFWEWKDLSATAKVEKGSRYVHVTSLEGVLKKGTQVRVGEHYITTVQGPEKQGVIEMADVAPDSAFDGNVLEGPLSKKIHKIRVTKDNVSIVFNLAVLHEKQGHHEAAQELHKAVLAEHPTYIPSE